MNQNTKTQFFLPIKTIAVFVVIVSIIAITTSGFREGKVAGGEGPGSTNQDSVESVTAFMGVYKVLISPRCMNCHPAGDIPLQGDDNHLHIMFPKRGKDGKGLYAEKCSNCHQPTNTPGVHTPPGNPNWHLPPANMKMVFQGKNPGQLAKQILDPAQNGHKNMQQLLEHATDTLVVSAWHPGEGRTLPPMSHADFKKAWETWLKKGAYIPK